MVTREEALAELQRRGVQAPAQPPALVSNASPQGGITRDQAIAELNRRQSDPQQNQEGFFSRVGGDLARRAPQVAEIIEGEGGTSSLEQALQLSAQGIGALGDIGAQGAVSAFRALPDPIERGISNVAGGALRALGSLPTGTGEGVTLAEQLPQDIATLSEIYRGFEAENPRAARNLEAAGVLGSLIPQGRALQAVGRGAGVVEDTGKALRRRADELVPVGQTLTADQVKGRAQKLYDVATSSGATIKPQLVDDVIDDITQAITPRSEAQKSFSEKLSREGQKRLKEVDDAFKNIQGQDLTIDDFNEIDKSLTNVLRSSDLVNEKGAFNEVGSQIKGIQEGFRRRVLNASDDLIDGGDDAAATLKKARELWQRQIKLRDIENIIEISQFAKQPKTAIQTSMKTLLRRIRSGKVRGYTPDEIDAIKAAADTGGVRELLDLAGSRLPSVVSLGTGNPVAAGALRVGSEAARAGSSALQLRKADDLASLISQGGRRISVDPEVRTNQVLGNILGTGLQATGRAGSGAIGLRLPQAAGVSALGNIQENAEQNRR